jgi:hypothetical protein
LWDFCFPKFSFCGEGKRKKKKKKKKRKKKREKEKVKSYPEDKEIKLNRIK